MRSVRENLSAGSSCIIAIIILQRDQSPKDRKATVQSLLDKLARLRTHSSNPIIDCHAPRIQARLILEGTSQSTSSLLLGAPVSFD